jgi:hypothetical protein
MGDRQKEISVAVTCWRRFRGGGGIRADAKFLEEARMERALDHQRLFGGGGKALHGGWIGGLGRTNGKGAGILLQVKRILDHIETKPFLG